MVGNEGGSRMGELETFDRNMEGRAKESSYGVGGLNSLVMYCYLTKNPKTWL